MKTTEAGHPDRGCANLPYQIWTSSKLAHRRIGCLLKGGEHIDQCSAMNDNPLADTATFQVGSNGIVGGNLLIEFIHNLGLHP